MKLRVQVVIESDDEDVHEVAQVDRDALSVDTLGLHLAEAKALLQNVQAVLIDEQVRTYLAQQVACPSQVGHCAAVEHSGPCTGTSGNSASSCSTSPCSQGCNTTFGALVTPLARTSPVAGRNSVSSLAVPPRMYSCG